LSGAGLQPAPLALRGRKKGASGGPGSAVVSGHLWAQHAYGVCGEGVAKAGTRVAHGTVDQGGEAEAAQKGRAATVARAGRCLA